MIPKIGQYWKHKNGEKIYRRIKEKDSKLSFKYSDTFYSIDLYNKNCQTKKDRNDIKILDCGELLDILYGEESEIRR